MLTLVSCNDADKDALTLATDTAGLANVDGDGDGFFAADDCNDADASIGPGSIEVCDGVDNNCDGLIDEGVLTISFADTDGDGYGNPEQPLEACGTADGAAPNANDCDDTNGAVFPGAAETCNDIDDDCDDEVDEGVTVTAYTDADGDGFGDSTTGVEVCEASAGQVLVAEDCDDNDPDAWPDNPEFCDEADNNCDGEIDEGVTVTYYRDDDGDGWGGFSGTAEACTVPDGYAAEAGDCDDSDTAYHPGATEDDCTDPNDYNCDGSVAYADADADGWPACEDCDDTQASVNPDSLEICNAIDDDCDGNIDDDDPDVDLSTGTTWYADADTDGYGDRSVTTLSCAVPSGFVADNTDCDDDATAVHPGATEVCDTIDNDCDGDIDDADSSLDTSTGVSFYIDSDTDGYGDPASSVMACEAPSGTVNSDADCDDGDATINPAATEVCDSVDNDCDGDIDDNDIDVTGQPTWYVDTDVDGYGSPTTTTQACVQPSGYVNSMSDCDDGDRSINPAASEVCDSIDNDCDGYIDDDDSSLDASTGSSFYRDSDADGYGSSASGTIYACSVASGYSTTSSDCDDGDSSTYPGASEACDGEDNDCDGSADNGATCSYQLVGSGGGSLCVDDDLYVNQNGSRIYTDSTWGAQCGHVVSFTGSPGDTLYMWAVDSVGGCRNMSDVYIKLVATGQIQYLASGYSNTCGHGASSSAFWSRSVSVPGAF